MYIFAEVVQIRIPHKLKALNLFRKPFALKGSEASVGIGYIRFKCGFCTNV